MNEFNKTVEDITRQLRNLENLIPSATRYQNFTSKSFKHSYFHRCELYSTYYYISDMRNSTMSGCDFTDAAFDSDCIFIDTNFSGVDLRYADLTGARIKASQLSSLVVELDDEVEKYKPSIYVGEYES